MNDMSERVRLGTAPLGYQPPDRETDGGMSLAPRGFADAVIRARKVHRMRQTTRIPKTDAEAERFLWHVREWVREKVPLSNREGDAIKEAEYIIVSRIDQLAGVNS